MGAALSEGAPTPGQEACAHPHPQPGSQKWAAGQGTSLLGALIPGELPASGPINSDCSVGWISALPLPCTEHSHKACRQQGQAPDSNLCGSQSCGLCAAPVPPVLGGTGTAR